MGLFGCKVQYFFCILGIPWFLKEPKGIEYFQVIGWKEYYRLRCGISETVVILEYSNNNPELFIFNRVLWFDLLYRFHPIEFWSA